MAMSASLRERLARAGVHFRDPPEPPTSCCGRGCNGCVWEGYYAALAYWRGQALELLARPAQTDAPVGGRAAPR
ncbi:MAG: oxidoreductase [Rhodocyclaceae bacterium]|nr:oxidoreductase [Rhodocyclaceae bacterium]